MIVIYNLGIGLYWLLIRIAAPFNEKARLWLTGRKKIFSRLEEVIDKNAPIAWFHAASLGEFEQGRPLMEAYKKENPDVKILLTFFSPSGYEIRKNYAGADYIFYLPLDTHRNSRRFLTIVNPSLVVFIKYEYWYHYLSQIRKRNIQLYMVSAIFRKEQVFFKSYGSWYRKILTYFTHLFVQDKQSVELLNSIGISNCTYAGDTRFDRVSEIATTSKDIETAAKFSESRFCFVCGSTWPQDEDLLAKYINTSPKNCVFIIAPHEIHAAHIAELIKKISVPCVLFSKAANFDFSKVKVLLIDNIGILSSLYKYGKVAYVGGGFGTGIHNILEAAVYGMPVVFGPKYHKFREARELIAEKGASSISNFEELEKVLNMFLNNPDQLKVVSEKSRNFVNVNRGATEIILNYLKHN